MNMKPTLSRHSRKSRYVSIVTLSSVLSVAAVTLLTMHSVKSSTADPLTTIRYRVIEEDRSPSRLVETKDEFIRYRVENSQEVNRPVSMRQWAQTLVDSPADILEFRRVLSDSPFAAFYWECAPVRMDQSDSQIPMEFVLVNAPELHRFVRSSPDTTTFREYFSSNSQDVATFANLGGDTTLIAPNNNQLGPPYTDMATFARKASDSQALAVYKQLGRTLLDRFAAPLAAQSPLWLSTCGLGASWLHIRLDAKPKYYTYLPFKRPPS